MDLADNQTGNDTITRKMKSSPPKNIPVESRTPENDFTPENGFTLVNMLFFMVGFTYPRTEKVFKGLVSFSELVFFLL